MRELFDIIANTYIGEYFRRQHPDNLEKAVAEANNNFNIEILPLFDQKYYLDKYPDIRKSGIHPILHYIKHGYKEKRWPNKYFNPEYYDKYIISTTKEDFDSLEEYCTRNHLHQGNPSPLVDLKFYAAAYNDIGQNGIDLLVHYIKHGASENRAVNHLTNGSFNPVEWKDSINSISEQIRDELNFKIYKNPELPKKYNRANIAKKYLYNMRENYQSRVASRYLNNREEIFFSIIIPTYNIELSLFKETLASALDQNYSNFEIIIYDDASSDLLLLNYLQEINKEGNNRIRIEFGKENGHISRATNRAAALCSGQYLVLLDHDDMLVPQTLNVLNRYIQENNYPDMLYSDEALIDGNLEYNEKSGVKFKTGWSPELLLSYSYISHVVCIKRDTYDKLGGMREGFEGSQDHDFFLRLSENTNHVVHIEEILYIRRAVATSMAGAGTMQKPYSLEAGRSAVEEAFKRRGLNLPVVQKDWAKANNSGIFTVVPADSGSKVSIIVPSINIGNLVRLLRSLNITKYNNYDINIVTNDPNFAIPQEVIKFCEVNLFQVSQEIFNYSELCNFAAQYATGEYLLFLNDDMEIIDSYWLSFMMTYIQLKQVGVVGAKLIFPDGRIQHAGISTNLARGYTINKNIDQNDAGYLYYAGVTRNCQAVTGACLLTRKSLFNALSGFNQDEFGIAYNDVDYCLRALNAGFRIVYCADAVLIHYETSTRNKTDKFDEKINLVNLYGYSKDIYFNSNWNRYIQAITPWLEGQRGIQSCRPINVLFVSHNLNYEGAPISIYNMIRGIRERYPYINISVLSPNSGPMIEKYEELGLKVFIYKEGRNLFRKPKIYNQVLETIQDKYLTGADLLIANTASAFWAIDAASRVRIPSIWLIREDSPHYYVRNGYWDIYKKNIIYAFQKASKVLFVAKNTYDNWKEFDSQRNFGIIKNSLDLHVFDKNLSRTDKRVM